MPDGREIGTDKQLFLNKGLVARSEGIRLVMNPAVPTGEAVIEQTQPHPQPGQGIEFGAYSSVLDDQGKIRMWCFTTMPHPDKAQQRRLCYAESEDGIHFRQPELGLFDINGSTANSAVIGDFIQGACVWIDPNAPAKHRYRTQAKFGPLDDHPPHVWFYASPDGLHWEKTHAVDIGACDTQNVVFWDPKYGRYVMYTRQWERSEDVNLSYRQIRRLVSDDLVTWEDQRIIWEADAIDLARQTTSTGKPPVDYYGGCVYRYPEAGDLYVLLAQPFWHWKDRPADERWGNSPDPQALNQRIVHLGPATIDVRLGYSLNGMEFEHAIDRGPFLPLGVNGRFDSRRVWAMPNPIVRDDEIWIYYTAGNLDHDQFVDPAAPGLRSGIGRAVMRLDGFVSAEADHTGGWLQTPLLRFEGQRLELNMDAGGGGCIRVELTDQQGKAIPGFSMDECQPLVGNSVRQTVAWQGQDQLGKLAGRPITLRCHLQEAKLFSFRFQ